MNGIPVTVCEKAPAFGEPGTIWNEPLDPKALCPFCFKPNAEHERITLFERVHGAKDD